MKKITHDYIKCELYRILVSNGFEVYPEVKYKEFKLRADLTVYYKGKFICLVETKNYRNQNKQPNFKGKQYKKYENSKLRFFYCVGLFNIMTTFNQIKSLA
jgi:type I site-specific restriction-modification system R (restriction) subunit